MVLTQDGGGAVEHHKLIYLAFFGCAALYAMRVNLSVAIVSMVSPGSVESSKSELRSDDLDTCPLPLDDAKVLQEKAYSKQGVFDWNEELQGYILGSFFYGYTLTNILGGRLAEKFGGKAVLGGGIFLTSLLTLFSPFAAFYSTNLFALLRVLEGMTEGVTFPALMVLVSKWIPVSERGQSIAKICGGTHFGTILTLSVSGFLCDSSWGWPSVFYLSGLVGLVWSLLWYLSMDDKPVYDLLPSESDHLASENSGNNTVGVDVPWLQIMMCVPFLSTVFFHFGVNWGFYFFLTELPTYLHNIQHFNIRSNGILSALPYLLLWAFGVIYSKWMDKLLYRRKLKALHIRRISAIIGGLLPMILVLSLASIGCNPHMAVILICLSMAFTGAHYCAYPCGFQELAPNFAGTLTGISNTFATLPGFLAPHITGTLTNNQQTLTSWRYVFLLTALVYFVTALTYIKFVSTDIQSWNSPKTKNKVLLM